MFKTTSIIYLYGMQIEQPGLPVQKSKFLSPSDSDRKYYEKSDAANCSSIGAEFEEV